MGNNLKKRLNVHLYVLPVCNLKCIHCYYEAKDMNFKYNEALSIENINFIITSLIDKYDTYFDIEGGELFLRKDINNMFNSLDKKYLSRLTITTNGTVDIDYNQSYLKNLDEVRVSFEGHTDKLQKEIRGINLKKPLNTALALLNVGVPVVIRLTLHKNNFKDVNEIISFFNEKGFNRFSFYEFQSSGRGGKLNDKYLLTDENIATVLNNLDCINKKIIFKFSFPQSRVSIIKKYTQYVVSYISNISSLTVDYDGNIGCCPWLIGKNNFDIFEKYTFNAVIQNLINNNQLIHNCSHCSYIRISNDS